MTKTELIGKMAADANISKAAAEKALGSLTDAIKEGLKKGDKIALIGFGTFSVSERKARKGRNPATGEEINIPATKVPKFVAGSALKEALKE
jgi:DNA-binding protein HU-beta